MSQLPQVNRTRLGSLFGDRDTNSLCIPYIIAEIGVNHEGKLDLAMKLIDQAKSAGADAVKFQSYKAELIASKNSPAYWDLGKESTTSQYELFCKYDSFWKKEYEELSEYCRKIGIDFLSTPFDLESCNFLADLMPAFKISSSDITNKPLIYEACKYSKPIILSTGASYFWEISEAVEWISTNGNDHALLHCVLNYPTADAHANLARIKLLREHFPGTVIGYSDHTLPGQMQILETATLLGATIIEKHFTHDKSLPGNDHYHAMDADDLRKYIERITNILQTIGVASTAPQEIENKSRLNARRSLVANRDIKKGDQIRPQDLIAKRPASGISPKDIEIISGQYAETDIPKDSILEYSNFSISKVAKK